MQGCSITDEYERRGIDVVLLENDALRVEILAGKGGDITEITNKRTDVNLLFEAPHGWRSPGDKYVGPSDPTFAFLDYYPGGWQDILPAAGGPTTSHGAPFGLHGETPLVPWDATIVTDTDEEVAVLLSVSLARYPFEIKRLVSLRAGESVLQVDETVRNTGEVGVDFSWLQHIAFGAPLLGPEASLDVPCQSVLVDPDMNDRNARFPPGEEFVWPTYVSDDGERIDLRNFPPKETRSQDLVALAELEEGRYTITNSRLDLATTVRFPRELFQYVWYWQVFGGFEDAPFFGRSYNVGLEPCTSIPNAGLERSIENGTARHLDAGESISATFEVETEPTTTQ